MRDDRVAEQNPYRPPVARIAAVSASLPLARVAADGFAPLQGAARSLGLWLWAHAVLNVIYALVTFWSYRQGVPFERDELGASDLLIAGVAVAQVGIYLVNIVLFARLVYRANQNVRALALRTPRYTPAAMVWWFFVPFANLVKPFDAFRDVYVCSFPRNERAEPHAILATWWTFWIAALIAENVSGRIPAESVVPTLIFTALATLLGVGSALSAALATRVLAERQDRTAGLVA